MAVYKLTKERHNSQNATSLRQTDTDLWLSSLTSDLSDCVCVSTQTVYLCFGAHVPHLFQHQTNLPALCVYWNSQ